MFFRKNFYRFNQRRIYLFVRHILSRLQRCRHVPQSRQLTNNTLPEWVKKLEDGGYTSEPRWSCFTAALHPCRIDFADHQKKLLRDDQSPVFFGNIFYFDNAKLPFCRSALVIVKDATNDAFFHAPRSERARGSLDQILHCPAILRGPSGRASSTNARARYEHGNTFHETRYFRPLELD